MSITEAAARPLWRKILGELLAAPVIPVYPDAVGEGGGEWDDLVECRGIRFAIEYNGSGGVAAVGAWIARRRAANAPHRAHAILAVERTTPALVALCEAHGIDWIDLAGNARVNGIPGLYVRAEGRPPLPAPRGRPRNAFAPASSRVAHWFLLNPGATPTHGELAEATGIDKGQLSRVLATLQESQLVRREGRIYRAPNRDLLFAAWREGYEIPARTILKGGIASRSGPETARIISEALQRHGIEHVLGGLAAAWFLDGYASFRIATCYIAGVLTEEFLEDITFLPSNRAPNLWLHCEADRVAFMGAEEKDGLRLASPWFTAVDLTIHPERASDAAEHLRERLGVRSAK